MRMTNITADAVNNDLFLFSFMWCSKRYISIPKKIMAISACPLGNENVLSITSAFIGRVLCKTIFINSPNEKVINVKIPMEKASFFLFLPYRNIMINKRKTIKIAGSNMLLTIFDNFIRKEA